MAARSSAEALILCPGEEGWELWKPVSGTYQLAEKALLSERGSPASFREAHVFGVPVMAAFASPFWVMSTETDMIEGTTELQFEKMNLKLEDGNGHLTHSVTIEQTEGQTLCLATVLQEKALTVWPKEIPQRFELTPNLFYLPDSELLIWKELGKLVACISREGRAVYFQALNSSTLDAQAVHDLQVMLMPLELQGVVTDLEGVRLWTEAIEPGADEWLREALDVPVRREAKPAPALPEAFSPLVPNNVAQARIDKARNARIRSAVLATAAIWLIGAAAFAWWCWQPMKQAKALGQELALKRNQFEWVAPEKTRWIRVLDIAHGDRLPVERLRQCCSMLNEEYGVRLTKWTYDPTKIIINIEAQDQARAYRYLNDIKKENLLTEYQCENTPPGNERNAVCKMTITGTLKSASANPAS